MGKISKILVCNRGEIAIRIFRACNELGIKTVAIYSFEDRFSLHRYKADEAYQVGEEGSPIGAYLNIEEIIEIAKSADVDAIHPGYGFLSEKVELRNACDEADIIFIGPTAETLTLAGSKVLSRQVAEKASVPVVPGSDAIASIDEAKKFSRKAGYPVIIKASFGGGGRGMRVVESESDLEASFNAARSEAEAGFGSNEVFIEKYVKNPKHIEVQLIGDSSGQVLHLFERDCSLQRRHQKVVEVAPAIDLDKKLKSTLHGYAIKIGKAIKLSSLSTAEFLVSEDGEIFFIEVNPRIQVEHTVTEEITGIDLVAHQIRIAEGKTLLELGLTQDEIQQNGCAIQCRITTEDPENNFTPDYGRLVAYRSASGFGIRLDAGSAFTGGEITPFYDSLLVKVTARGRTMEEAAARLRRANREFRVRGVKTNIAFLENILSHPVFLAGKARTGFLEEFPEVFTYPGRRNRANRLLTFIADVTVNGHELMPNLKRPSSFPEVKVPHYDKNVEAPRGWRNVLLDSGVTGLVDAIKKEESLLVTDTTFRDAHQSLLATRMRTYDMLAVANTLSRQVPQLFSVEMWGGATFDVCLRFLKEDPWQRLEALREVIPNILFQMLLRGANAVGYKAYPDNVLDEFVKEAAKTGIDIFRIFDCFNNLSRMQNAINAVKEAGAVAEVSICFSGDLEAREIEKARSGDDAVKFTLDYYRTLAESFVSAGADIIAIKDMAGLCRPKAARMLVSALKEAVDVPIHFHTHDTAGVQTSAYLDAASAGVDIVDCAFSSMAGVTSQPTLEGVVAALASDARSTGMALSSLTPLSNYWESVRAYYAPFESDLKTTTAEVYHNEIPGGQYSNFRPQAESVGLGDRFAELKEAYAQVNKLFGDVIKVTPSSKVVGDLAIFMLLNNLTIDEMVERASELDFPESVLGFLLGEIGEPYGGYPEVFRERALKGREVSVLKDSSDLPPADFVEATRIASELLGKDATKRDALSYLLYPKVFEQFAEARKKYSELMIVPSKTFFFGMQEGEEVALDIDRGKRLFVRLVAISEPEDNGTRAVFFELNGQPRSISIKDASVATSAVEFEKADKSKPGHIAAPLAGTVASIDVKEGDSVAAKQLLFTMEAMKMQTAVTAHVAGVVKRVVLDKSTRVSTGDLVIELE